MGEPADKSDGIGEQRRHARLRLKAAGGGVQGGEEFVLHRNIRAGEGVEQAGLARVGIAHNGANRQTLTLALPPPHLPLFPYFLKFFFQPVNPLFDFAAVGFQPGFSAAPRTITASPLAGKIDVLVTEAGQKIRQLRQFYL